MTKSGLCYLLITVACVLLLISVFMLGYSYCCNKYSKRVEAVTTSLENVSVFVPSLEDMGVNLRNGDEAYLILQSHNIIYRYRFVNGTWLLFFSERQDYWWIWE